MKILYITAQIPWGKGETFILEEMLEVKHQGIDLLVIPRNPPKEIFHKEAEQLLENSIWLSLTGFGIIVNFFIALLTKINLWKILGILLIHSRNHWIFLKNLAVLPKAVFITKMIKKKNIKHIHAHWGSTTATMGYIISRLTGIPWSFTLHRWDIKENNMLLEKIKSVEFVRCISEHGARELLDIIGMEYKEKIKVIYMGVKIPKYQSESEKNKELFKIIVPANLVGKKGHKYLIEACSNLIEKGVKNFQCIFYGEGSLRGELESLIHKKKLSSYIKMPGVISHEKLIKMYDNQEVDMVILPSIITNKGELEGIPVSLMEAMAYKIPVISTDTGGTPELLSQGAGIIVKEKSPEQLAEAILKVMNDENFRKQLIEKEYQKVQNEFDIKTNTKILLELIKDKSYENFRK